MNRRLTRPHLLMCVWANSTCQYTIHYNFTISVVAATGTDGCSCQEVDTTVRRGELVGGAAEALALVKLDVGKGDGLSVTKPLGLGKSRIEADLSIWGFCIEYEKSQLKVCGRISYLLHSLCHHVSQILWQTSRRRYGLHVLGTYTHDAIMGKNHAHYTKDCKYARTQVGVTKQTTKERKNNHHFQ